MKRFFKWIFINVDILFQTVISILSVIFFSKIYTHRKINNLKKYIKNKENCYILGNGPSLRIELIGKEEMLRNSNVFAINAFAKTELFQLIRPQHYFYIDPDLWRENVPEALVKEREILIEILTKKTDWEMFFYVPWEAYNNCIFKNNFINHKNIVLVPINITPVKGFQKISFFLYKLNLGMPRPQNVLIASIFISINLGFKKIHILGCDHSWIENIKVNHLNQVCIKDEHFYDSTEIKLVPWIKDRDNNVYKMHEVLMFFVHTFYSHHLIREYADFSKTKILNITSNSHIDVYERGIL